MLVPTGDGSSIRLMGAENIGGFGADAIGGVNSFFGWGWLYRNHQTIVSVTLSGRLHLLNGGSAERRFQSRCNRIFDGAYKFTTG